MSLCVLHVVFAIIYNKESGKELG